MSLTKEYVRSLFVYDEATGVLFWRENKGRSGKAGKEAGSDLNGYRRIGVDGVDRMAHRLIWLYVHGYEPTEHIDHIDGNPSNNRIENLREASNTKNMENQRRALKNNKSGFLGVSYVHERNKYRAQIWVGSKRIHVGYFDDAESAHAAYVYAKRELHDGCTI